PAFFCDAAPAPPDILLFAKNMGNGFPVSALALADQIQVSAQALPGSTFAGNPFALASVRATLECMASLPMTAMVLALEATARRHFEPLAPLGVCLRGSGALWCLNLAPSLDMVQLAVRIKEAGILVSLNGRVIRLLPAATIAPDLWDQACARIANACLGVVTADGSLAGSLA
ncbi:MAG: aminotransferase class III-fold pyridoxal phosphate-dependent enzyme, partial [Haliea sp.]